ncbi:MAG: hypothetical protein IJW13_04365, partial [Clostridia bacterium]|nr:hypothetical protein [Clostridia bacterium]
HCEVLMEIFYGGELGVDPDTPVNKIRESLENIQAISFSVEEKRFNPAEQEFWSDLSSGIYTVALEFFLEKHLTYVFAFEKEEITDFLIEFIDGRSEKVIYSFELPIGKELTLDSYPDLPSDGPGYTVSWSNTDSFIPDRNVKIYAVYNYTQYAINYVYDDELFEEAYGGHDYYTVATDSSGEIMPVSLKTMYSAKKKFLGWSTQLNGQPIREFKADLSNLNGVTLYLIAEDYTSEELSFYQQFENTLNLSQYTLTNVEEDRIIVVDKASKYAHAISQFSNNEKKSTVIWYGDYYYNLSGGWYCEKPFEEEISHITDIGLAHCFPKNKCATNIVKTADGYQYDLVFADESYAFTVKSNGNYFTAIESEYAKTHIKATLSNKAEKLKIPTNLEFKVFPRTTVTDVDLGEFVFDLDTSHLNYADFVEYFEKSTFNYESKHIYLGLYTDKELTTPLTESYYNSNKNNRLSIYTKFIDKKEYIDRILIGVDVYVEYDHSQTGQRNKVLLESLSLSVSDLVLLPALCEKYDGWGQYGYILSNDMATVYDRASLILKEGKGRVGIFNEIDVYQWISTNLNKLISGDYSIEVCIFTDVQSCHITIEGYGSFYHDPYLRPTEWLIEKDGMVPSGYYKDAECTNSISEREYLGSEITIYCTWEKGEIVTITVYEDENRNKQIKTSTAVSIYDLNGYWWVDQPFFYDKQLTLAVPYGTRPEDGKTYYINSSIKEVEFTIICNQVAYKTKGYKNTSLQFNMLSRNGIFSKIESELRKLDLLPDYSESFLNLLIKEGALTSFQQKKGQNIISTLAIN